LIQNVIARRYAEALFLLAREQDLFDTVDKDLQLVRSFYVQDHGLRDLMSHQRVSTRQKKEIVRNLWQPLVSATVLVFIELVLDKHRERYLEDIIQVFGSLLQTERNIAVAEVMTAFPMTPAKEERLCQVLEQKLHRQIELQVSVHPELIGGLVVKVGDRVYDGSLTKRLLTLGVRLVDRSLGKLEVET
jgi:F-type H+-transporting ATPase subunit delta